MLRVGLSGNRYSGKSRVATIFKQIGVPIFEADVILKFILQHNYELQGLIRDKIGHKYYNNGMLDVNKAKDKGVFSKILDIIEPELYRAWEKFQEKNSKSVYCIFHSSVLYERQWNKAMDKNITVFSPFSDRVDRCKYLATASSSTLKSVSSIYNLLSTEMDELEKNKLAHYVIHNYNNDNPFYGDTLGQVNDIDKKIVDNYLKSKITTKEFAL